MAGRSASSGAAVRCTQDRNLGKVSRSAGCRAQKAEYLRSYSDCNVASGKAERAHAGMGALSLSPAAPLIAANASRAAPRAGACCGASGTRISLCRTLASVCNSVADAATPPTRTNGRAPASAGRGPEVPPASAAAAHAACSAGSSSNSDRTAKQSPSKTARHICGRPVPMSIPTKHARASRSLTGHRSPLM
eukprot:scaffold14520_cov109-Isochrysis_galbana.AAC.6